MKTKNLYGFVFSSDIKDWNNSSKKLKAKAERSKKHYEENRKEPVSDNPGRRHVQMMNDNLRA